MTATVGRAAAPLSTVQETLLLLADVPGAAAAYHSYACLRLRGALDADALAEAVRRVVARHAPLRSAITAEGLLETGEEAELVRTRADGDVRAAAAAEVRRPFDLGRGPLWRAHLWELATDEYVFLWCAHRVVCDERSVAVVLEDLAAAYARPETLGQPPVTWADHVDHEREALEHADAERIAAYWRERLAGTPDVSLPADRPRPARSRFRTGVVRRRIDFEREVALPVALAAVAALLRRSTGHAEIVVGMPYDGRSLPGTERLAGSFGTRIPVRLDVGDEPTLAGLVERAGAAADEAAAHGALPLPRIVDALRDDPDRSRVPLFRVGVGVDDGDFPALPGVDAEPEPLDVGTAELELTITLRPLRGALELVAEYDVDQYDCGTIERFLAHLVAMLRAPEELLGDVVLDESAAIVHEWTPGPHRPPGTVLELFAEQAARTPAARAVECGAAGLTFDELRRRANRIAHLLRAHGAERDRRVALCLPRTLDLPTAVLGILKAGAAYVPLDPSLPPERLHTMLADAEPIAVLAHSELADRLPECSAPVLVVDRLEAELAERPDDDPPLDAGPADLAYVLYTSGTTGQPKGIAMTHAPPANLIAWQLRLPRRTPPGEGRTLQFTTIAFDVAFQELFATWCAGDALVLVDEEVRADPERLLDALRELEITTAYLPFVALDQLAHAAELLDAVPATLRDVYQAGEQLKVTPALRRLFAVLPDCLLHNHYGPTETHVCTALTLPPSPEEWPELPSIGRPIDSTRCFVLDAKRRPVPSGGIGHLHVGGVQVARGYLNRDELTSDRFVEIDGGDGPERVYDTGDLVRVDSRGELQFLGRADTQVKIHGYRVELGEIETALAEHPAVAATAVALRTLGSQPALVAYWVGTDAPEEELRERLAERLPPYMLPRRYVRLDRFPSTASGKIDRKALPEPEVEETGANGRLETPWEELVADVLARRLDATGLGRDDRFFELGGHSLAALGVIGEIKALCGVQLPVSALLGNASVTELGAALEAEVSRALRPDRLEALLDQASAGQGGPR